MNKTLKQSIASVTSWIYKATASTRFFVAAVLLLVVQSVWLAFSAIYPMPFDEYVHVGIIQIYARQWSPFIPVQPPEASLFGDITRTVSYLYHYLMSFPYRVLDIFIDSEMAMVISLRLINIAMVVGALFLFRKLFIMWKIPKRVVNVALLLFVFTPIVPFVAAHVNYDNLILLLMPVVLIFGTRLIIDHGDVAWNGTLFGIFGLAAVLSKGTFLPLYSIIGIYVLWRLWREHGMKFWQELWKSVNQNARHASYMVAIIVLLVLGGLFLERYGGNFMRYKSLRVQCERVQPESVCEDFGPWYRDNITNVKNRPAEPPYGNPISFSQYWVTRMVRGYYAAFSHTPTKVVWEKEPFGPIVARSLLPLQVWVGSVALVGGLLAFAAQWRKVVANKSTRFILVVCGFYLLAVWAFNYNSYLRIWRAEAIQARYTYPILLLMFVLFVQCINWTIASKKLKAGLVVALIPLYVWGGGIAAWLIRADETWVWQNATIQSVNKAAHELLWHTVAH